MADTIYYGISGDTLTISGTSVSAARTQYSSASGEIMPWYGSRDTITKLVFVNNPKITDFYTEVDSGFSPTKYGWFGGNASLNGLNRLTSISGTVDTSGATNLAKIFYMNPLETINLPDWDVDEVTTINNIFGTTVSANVSSLTLTNWNLAKCSDLSAIFNIAKNATSVDLTGCKFPKLTDISGLFRTSRNLTTMNLSAVEFANATTAASMFENSNLLTLTATGLSMPSVADFSRMFRGCSKLVAADFQSVTVGSPTNMYQMFYSCTSLVRVNLTGWNVASVTTMEQMFYGCTSLASVAGFLASAKTALTTANAMFRNCKALTSLDMSGFNSPALVDAGYMFYGCTGLTTLNCNGWQTGALSNINCMFRGCRALTALDCHTFNVSACQQIDNAFSTNPSLVTLNLHGWTLTACESLGTPFAGCTRLESLDVDDWSTAALETMDRVFANLSKLTALDVTSWDVSSVTSMGGAFLGCSRLTSIDLSTWDTSACINFSRSYNGATYEYSPFFSGCMRLISVELGAGFTTAQARARDDPSNMLYYSKLDLAPALNLTSGVFVADDDGFATLRATEIDGTWHVGGEQMLSCFAFRSDHGQADEQGLDITVDCMWHTDATTTARALRVYVKSSTDTNFPTTPAATNTSISGAAGDTVIVLSNVGSGNYDLRVEFYDGTTTYVCFPSISSDTQLLSLTPSGDLKVLGTLECAGSLAIGNITMTELQLQQLLALLN